ncbi:MAG: molybdenum cofactor guanylyltransferase [Halobacteriota archaeon]|uniref:molybdenum cofactor guanylyltransferase n=1 Tax=Natronomonas sp. TaxID=2184060 RepID=UPI0039768C43
MTETSGVIVAGGRSIRMGEREKTVVDVAGTPLIRRVADRLAVATDVVVVNCRDEQREAIAEAFDALDVETRFALDPVPDRGPVAGILTGLEAAATEYAVVVAADMPFLDPGLLAYLTERAVGHEVAIPRPGEWFEPLHAVYKTEPTVEACKRALQHENPQPIEPISTLDRVVVSREELLEHGSLDSFESIDTLDDLAWAREQLS